MASPIVVGTTAIVAVPVRSNRAKVRFQNAGATTLYFKRNSLPTILDYEFSLSPGSAVFDENAAHIETRSTSSFYVLSSAAAGSLAIMETIFI